MERLTIKELAPYLPYKLKVKTRVGDKILEMMSLSTVTHKGQICIETYDGTFGDMWFKPLLRPLSSLTEEIEWKRKLLSFLSDGRSDNYDSPIEIRTKPNQITFKIRMYYYRGLNNNELFEYTVYKNLDKRFTKYSLIEWAIENHFDVFNLIPRGLALPSEEDVTQKVIEQERGHRHAVDYNNGYDMGFNDCFDFILNNLKSNTNETDKI